MPLAPCFNRLNKTVVSTVTLALRLSLSLPLSLIPQANWPAFCASHCRDVLSP